MASTNRRSVVISSTVNERDQGAVLTVAIGLAISYSFIFLIVRGIIRRPLRSLLGWDDATIGAVTFIGALQSIVTVYAVSQGLGARSEDLSIVARTRVYKSSYAANALYTVISFGAKLAVAMFLKRLSDDVRHRRYCYALSVACILGAVVSVLLLCIQLPLSQPWNAVFSRSQMYRWVAVESVSGAIDISIIAYPIMLVKDLQMRSWLKVRIVASIAMRCILLPLAILRLLSWPRDETDTFRAMVPELYLQIQMCYSIISATMPCIGVFLQGASPDFLGGTHYINHTTSAMAVSGGSGKSWRTYEMSNLSRRRRGYDEGDDSLIAPEYGETTAQAMRSESADREHPEIRSVESDSSQQAIVVHRSVVIQVSGKR